MKAKETAPCKTPLILRTSKLTKKYKRTWLKANNYKKKFISRKRINFLLRMGITAKRKIMI